MQLQVGKTYQSHRPAETIEMANGGIIKFIRNESAREKSKKAIFLYDRSGLMAQPWLDAGYECWLFDGQHEKGVHRYGNLVKVGMWFDPYLVNHHVREIRELVGEGVRFVFGFPECTDMAVSGAAHFKNKRAANPNFQKEAMSLAMMVKKVGDSFDCKWGVKIQ